MGRKYQAAKIVYDAKDQIIELHNKRLTLLEIHETIPNLKEQVSYSSLARICADLQLFDKKKKNEKIENSNSTTKENFVNEKTPTENSDKLSSNAEKNLEKLTKRKPGFSYDHSTKGKDFI